MRPLFGGAPGGVDYLVAVVEVVSERPLGHEQLLALVFYQDLAAGLEEAPRGPAGGEFDLLACLGGR